MVDGEFEAAMVGAGGHTNLSYMQIRAFRMQGTRVYRILQTSGCVVKLLEL